MTDHRVPDQDVAVFYVDDTYNTLYRLRAGKLVRWSKDGWVDASVSLGRVDGTGGDGHARRVSRDDARAFIDARSPT